MVTCTHLFNILMLHLIVTLIAHHLLVSPFLYLTKLGMTNIITC